MVLQMVNGASASSDPSGHVGAEEKAVGRA